jgi:hypothetical protein
MKQAQFLSSAMVERQTEREAPLLVYLLVADGVYSCYIHLLNKKHSGVYMNVM